MQYNNIDDRPGALRKGCSTGDHRLRFVAVDELGQPDIARGRFCEDCPYTDRLPLVMKPYIPPRVAARIVR